MKKLFFELFKRSVLLFAGSGLGKIRIFDKAYHFLLPKLKPEYTEIGGYKIVTDKLDSLSLSVFGIYEKTLINTIKTYIKKGDVVCDIGAHDGYHTLDMSKAVGRNGKVYAFEPDPDNFDLLKKNLENNAIKNVILVKKAISDRCGVTKLYQNPANRSDNGIIEKGNGFSFTEVETISLDRFFAKRNKVDFIKMDIQGAEPLAYKGMTNLIRKNKHMKIIMELRPGLIKNGIRSSQIMLNGLYKSGFSFYYINDLASELELIDVDTLLKLAIEKLEINIFCIRKKHNV